MPLIPHTDQLPSISKPCRRKCALLTIETIKTIKRFGEWLPKETALKHGLPWIAWQVGGSTRLGGRAFRFRLARLAGTPMEDGRSSSQ
jgi:hypothetical protein